MNFLESILLTLSNLLFYPVIVGVLIVVLHQCLSIGKLLKEFKLRRQGKHFHINTFKKRLHVYLPEAKHDASEIEFDLLKLLRRWEQDYQKTFNSDRLVIKVGPALGLMGTLIPMGTALASLSQGDLMLMSVNMVTAFTTTVVGMACGLSAFVINHQRSAWYKSDLLDCEIRCEGRFIQLKKQANIQISESAAAIKSN